MAKDAQLEAFRKHLYILYKTALEAVQGKQVVAQHLSTLALDSPPYLLAVGKAAASMTQGAMQVLACVQQGLVVSKYGYLDDLPAGLESIESAHPVPDENSLRAGRRVLDFVQSVPSNGTLVALISGGASALVEHLAEPFVLTDLQRINQWLLASGLDIEQMNGIRKQISCIKGGRLATHFRGKQLICLLISDVPEDDPATIGSGLFAAGTSRIEVDESILPAFIRDALRNAPAMPDATDDCFKPVTLQVVANLSMALDAAEAAARSSGLAVVRHDARLQGDVQSVARRVSDLLSASTNAIHLWGGEPSVQLPDNPGRGGRCQSLALYVAQLLQGMDGWCLLAAGTDGSDGPGTDAGALVDGQSIARARQVLGESLQVEDYLRRADAGTVLSASGDLLVTGPTGSNVTDLVIGCRFNSL